MRHNAAEPAYMYVYTYVSNVIHKRFQYIHICIHAHPHLHTHIHTHAHTHAHTHPHTHTAELRHLLTAPILFKFVGGQVP